MLCRVCGFFGEFEIEEYVSQVNPECSAVGGYDSYGNGSGVEAITNINPWVKKLHICPKCRIAYKLIEK